MLLVALAEPDLCRAAVDLGHGRGFKVVATPQADQALRIAQQRQPDGMIVGMSMAVHDGSSLLHGLKRTDGTRHIPTVAAHSAQSGESAHQGRIVCALDVIEEPLTRAKVDAAMQLLDSYIERKERSLLVATAEEDGAVLNRVPNVDAYEGTLFLYAELATDGRNSHALVKDLIYT